MVAISAAEKAEANAEGVERVVHDPCGGWASKRQVGPSGALLVRPDGHVTWRCEQFEGESPERADEMLQAAIQSCLAV